MVAVVAQGPRPHCGPLNPVLVLVLWRGV
jgi:hypothetical protein